MSPTPKPKKPIYKADFQQVLFFHDGPQLILLKMARNAYVLGVGVEEVYDRQFLGVKISQKQFASYMRDRFDLRYVILNPDSDMWFEFDLPTAAGRVDLSPVELPAETLNTLAPDHGIFARDHTEAYADLVEETRSVQKFLVDGNWDMREFSKFHAQVSDLYALSKSVDYFDGDADDKHKKAIIDAFIKPWKGGGSYLGFFRSLSRVGSYAARPDIKAIQWASPGYIEVLGSKASFDKIITLVEDYGNSAEEIKSSYDHLWSYLSEHRLLRASLGGFDNKSVIASELLVRASELASSLRFGRFDVVMRMASGNALVIAKVMLATKRRVEKLHAFFAEGRLAVDDEAID